MSVLLYVGAPIAYLAADCVVAAIKKHLDGDDVGDFEDEDALYVFGWPLVVTFVAAVCVLGLPGYGRRTRRTRALISGVQRLLESLDGNPAGDAAPEVAQLPKARVVS